MKSCSVIILSQRAMMRWLRRSACLMLLASPCLLTGCFTGIEGTKRIELSKEDRRNLAPSGEELLMGDVAPALLREWRPGKRFTASADKSLLIFEQTGLPALRTAGSFAGKMLKYVECENRKSLDGSEEVLIIFSDDSVRYLFNTHRRPEDAFEKFTSANLPMMIDLDRVDLIDSKLRGKKLWTLSSLWYDARGERKVGKKFVPVYISNVAAGDSVFPVKVSFSCADRNNRGDSESKEASGSDSFDAEWSMLMNYGGDEAGSRRFSSLFSLTDPRLKHKAISDEAWENICNGVVARGMTKEECRLALGSPTDTDTGHNYSTLLDIWRYADGRVLRFADGLLVDVRY